MILLRVLANLVCFNFLCLVLCETDENTQDAEIRYPVYSPVFVEMVNNLTSMSNEENRHENINVSIDIKELSDNKGLKVKEDKKELGEMSLEHLTTNDTLSRNMNNTSKERIKLIFPTSSFKEKLNISKPSAHSKASTVEKSINDMNQNMPLQNISNDKSTGQIDEELKKIATTPTPLVKLIRPFKHSQVMRRTADLNNEELSRLEQTVVNEMIKKYSTLRKGDKTLKIESSEAEISQPNSFNSHKTPNFGSYFRNQNNEREYIKGVLIGPSAFPRTEKPQHILPTTSPVLSGEEVHNITTNPDSANTSEGQMLTNEPDDVKVDFTIDPDTKEVIFDSGIISPEFLQFVNMQYNDVLAKYNQALTNYKVYLELYNKAKEMGTI